MKLLNEEKLSKKHPYLRSIEGWYKAEGVIPYAFQGVMRLYRESKSPMKATRWLLRNQYITYREAVVLGAHLNKEIVFKLSCRFNDLFRCRQSPHYHSCLAGLYARQLPINIADKDLAVLYVPDKAGHMNYRALVRLVAVNTGFGLFVYHGYGNGDRGAILEALRKLNITIIDGDLTYKTFGFGKFYRSVSRCKKRQAWSDHQYTYNLGHLMIKGES